MRVAAYCAGAACWLFLIHYDIVLFCTHDTFRSHTLLGLIIQFFPHNQLTNERKTQNHFTLKIKIDTNYFLQTWTFMIGKYFRKIFEPWWRQGQSYWKKNAKKPTKLQFFKADISMFWKYVHIICLVNWNWEFNVEFLMNLTLILMQGLWAINHVLNGGFPPPPLL